VDFIFLPICCLLLGHKLCIAKMKMIDQPDSFYRKGGDSVLIPYFNKIIAIVLFRAKGKITAAAIHHRIFPFEINNNKFMMHADAGYVAFLFKWRRQYELPGLSRHTYASFAFRFVKKYLGFIANHI